MKKLPLFLIPALMQLGACTSMPLTPPKQPAASSRAEVIVFREHAFNSGGVSATFGANEQAFVYLGNAEYASIFFAPGTYRFFVRARSEDALTLEQTVKADEKHCLKTFANPLNLAKAFVPFGRLMISDPTFLLVEVECPSSGQLAKYSRVEVEYQKQ